MHESNNMLKALALGFLVALFANIPAYAQDPVEVATSTSIYTVEASYSAGGNDFVRVKVVIEFAHVPGATFTPSSQDGIDSSGGAKKDGVVSRSPRRLRF